MILNHEIETSTASWTTAPRSAEAMARWYDERVGAGFPVLAAEADGVVGYAAWGRFRAGEGYDGVVEHSVYVAERARRRGVARALLGTLCERAAPAGVRVMIGGVSGDQPASLALHRALGFEEIAVLPRIGRKFGRVFMPLSCGALLDHMDLVDRARETGARIIVPTGALIGLDTVRAMAVGELRSATLVTRKPPRGLEGAPHLVENDIDVMALTEPTRVFEGTAREAAIGFPANVNVAAALSLAGIGPDRTTVEVWADPSIDRNMQTVRLVSDSAEAEMTIRNIPSEENPRTGRITALSVIACLQRMTAPMVAGT